jgi:hypothetical protein
LISSHAGNDTSSTAAFSLVVTIRGKRGVALVDSGSTYIFMDYSFASQLNYPITNIIPKGVRVVGGGSLDTNAIMTDVSYTVQKETFTNDFKLLQLRGYDLILGCDYWSWFERPFKAANHTKRGKRKVTFEDFTAPPARPVLKAAKLEKYCRTDIIGYVVQVQMIQSKQSSSPPQALPREIQIVLHNFADVFSNKVGLPPQRSSDHKIPLQPNSKPPNVRPYRIPHKQKNELDKLIKSMMQENIIRPSNSPYSSLAILVKKYGSWRLCINYRELNSQTIKDKFHIPIIEDLLDELFGAQIFSKLDLKSGYHQIRMNEEDIHKTTFRTSFGHYEFLVIPFVLTNAPVTFQSLMNQLFVAKLRKFVLVFLRHSYL